MLGIRIHRSTMRLTDWQLLAVAVLGASLIAATPAHALDDGQQLLVGGSSGGAAGVRYSSPGLANFYGNDFPGTGLGEQGAQVRTTAGTPSKLRANAVTQGTASSGSVTVTVPINAADTVLIPHGGHRGRRLRLWRQVDRNRERRQARHRGRQHARPRKLDVHLHADLRLKPCGVTPVRRDPARPGVAADRRDRP